MISPFVCLCDYISLLLTLCECMYMCLSLCLYFLYLSVSLCLSNLFFLKVNVSFPSLTLSHSLSLCPYIRASICVFLTPTLCSVESDPYLRFLQRQSFLWNWQWQRYATDSTQSSWSKVYQRWNQNNRAHAVTECIGLWHHGAMHAIHACICLWGACIGLWCHMLMHALTAWHLKFQVCLRYTFTREY